MPPFLMHSLQVIQQTEGDNDGLVSVRSATWGRHLAIWPADHLHVINKRLVNDARDAAERRRRVLGDDHPDTILSLGSHADVLRSLDGTSEAKPRLAELCRRRENAEIAQLLGVSERTVERDWKLARMYLLGKLSS